MRFIGAGADIFMDTSAGTWTDDFVDDFVFFICKEA